MVLGKRSRPDGIRAASKRQKAAAQPRAVLMKPSQKAKMLSILNGHTESASVVTRLQGSVATTATAAVLTSSTASASASSSSGQLGAGNVDSVLLNYVDIRGKIFNDVYVAAAAAAGEYTPAARLLVVYFNKPIQQAAAGGATLPPITEVLESDELESMVIAPDKQNGRFVVLSDRIIKPALQATPGATNAGVPIGRTDFQYRVKINKKCHFVSASSATGLGGHYDSSATPGLVNKGLLVMYWISDYSGAGFVPQADIRTRLNFTG